MGGIPFDEWRAHRLETFRLKRNARKPPITDSIPDVIDVAAIRSQVRDGYQAVTQEIFGRRFGFSAAAVRDWEQGRRRPDRASRVLLTLIKHDPAAVEALIQAAIKVGEAPASA